MEMVLARSGTRLANDLPLSIDSSRAAKCVTIQRPKISHYAILREKCMGYVSEQIGSSDNFPSVIDSDCDPVVSSQRAQILHWPRRSPKKRVERQVSRQGGCTHDLAEVIK